MAANARFTAPPPQFPSPATIIAATLRPLCTDCQQDDCIICYDRSCDVRLPCGHDFCRDCARRHLSEHDSCPTCRHGLFSHNVPQHRAETGAEVIDTRIHDDARNVLGAIVPALYGHASLFWLVLHTMAFGLCLLTSISGDTTGATPLFGLLTEAQSLAVGDFVRRLCFTDALGDKWSTCCAWMTYDWLLLLSLLHCGVLLVTLDKSASPHTHARVCILSLAATVGLLAWLVPFAASLEIFGLVTMLMLGDLVIDKMQ